MPQSAHNYIPISIAIGFVYATIGQNLLSATYAKGYAAVLEYGMSKCQQLALPKCVSF
jgi:hypothetical protein